MLWVLDIPGKVYGIAARKGTAFRRKSRNIGLTVKQMAGKSQIKPERRNRYVKCKGYGRFTLYS